MTRIVLLKKYLEKEKQRLFETSADYKLQNPKRDLSRITKKRRSLSACWKT